MWLGVRRLTSSMMSSLTNSTSRHVRFDFGPKAPNRAVCGVLLIGSHDSTRYWGIRCCLVVVMGACHGIAVVTVERERCVSELMHRGGVGFGSCSLTPHMCAVL